MILIFGGTTEGRLAINVCEEAGKPYYYSTKGSSQVVEMHNGVRLCGAMTAADIRNFCREHDIKCIVDAAHPFAEGLHQTIADAVSSSVAAPIPVIRLQRQSSDTLQGVTFCDGYPDAIKRLSDAGIKRLLALSGANTISKLKSFWSSTPTVFRILNREESVRLAEENGFPTDNIIFYNDNNELPSFEEEVSMMRPLACDAMITKESGKSGGIDAKVKAALCLGMRVFVIRAPRLPYPWQYVTGRYGLRRAIEHIVPEFFPLHTGFTTGACATAATKAALLSLLNGDCPEEVSFALPDGEIMTIPIAESGHGWATVIKDYSDDPDVLRGCEIKAEINPSPPTLLEEGDTGGTIRFLQGSGVGRVTLPGLGIPVGEPAINPTPRQMITNEIRAFSDASYNVTISVENGAELALRTFNHKVGVVGGISIIGTSGIVHPLSNDAFIQSIRRELTVAHAIGCREIGLVAGMKSEHALQQQYPDLHCIHYGNFVGEALKAAYEIGFASVHVSIMTGKAVKLAEGHLDTHSHKVLFNREFLCRLAPEYADRIRRITMARELNDFMPPSFFDRIAELCQANCRTVFPKGDLNIHLNKT